MTPAEALKRARQLRLRRDIQTILYTALWMRAQADHEAAYRAQILQDISQTYEQDKLYDNR